MKTAKISPREANTDTKANSLESDNKVLDGCWILVSTTSVTLCNQKSGEEATEIISLSKRDFNALIDWYNKKQ